MAIGGKLTATKEEQVLISLITTTKTDEDRGTKWIACSLLQNATGDIAVVVDVQMANTRDSVLLFSNNLTTNDKVTLDSEDKQAQVILKELDALYRAQLPLVAAHQSLDNLHDYQSHRLLQFSLRSGAINNLYRKLMMLRKLGHFNDDSSEIDVTRAFLVQHIDSFKNIPPPLHDDPLLRFFNKTPLSTTTPKLLTSAIEYISKISINKDARAFERLCQMLTALVHHPILQPASTNNAALIPILSKLQRRLRRVIFFAEGTTYVVKNLFERIRNRNKIPQAHLSLLYVNKMLHDILLHTPSTHVKSCEDIFQILLNTKSPEGFFMAKGTRVPARLLAGRLPWQEGKVDLNVHAEIYMYIFAKVHKIDLGYMAVTKLPCWACSKYLSSAMDIDGKITCNVSGTSWKAYAAWRFPRFQDGKIPEGMSVQDIEKAVMGHMVNKAVSVLHHAVTSPDSLIQSGSDTSTSSP